ncbi:MAG: hypothetical protein QOC92_1738, partial [Acidimicrobiaceae bacterium]
MRTEVRGTLDGVEPAEAVAVDDLLGDEARFRALIVEHASDVVQFMDAEGRILWTSPAVRRVLGYEPEELIGRLGSEICHPDDYERVFKQFVDLLDDPTNDSLRIESRSLHKDGSWVWVESIIRSQLDDPAVRGIVTNFRDISARIETEHALRESEARYRSVAGASPIGIYEMDETP